IIISVCLPRIRSTVHQTKARRRHCERFSTTFYLGFFKSFPTFSNSKTLHYTYLKKDFQINSFTSTLSN
uniref:Uncharacterized protein n=1 Tax=Solanum lycopersicum TaxID=4081 RepID=A0A3Q7HYZ8_SOLLC